MFKLNISSDLTLTVYNN